MVWCSVIINVFSHNNCDINSQDSCTHHLPDLHDVVFRHGADHPGLVRVPCEVWDLRCMTTVDKLEQSKSQLSGFRNIILMLHSVFFCRMLHKEYCHINLSQTATNQCPLTTIHSIQCTFISINNDGSNYFEISTMKLPLKTSNIWLGWIKDASTLMD